jgi:glycerol-3-phosphate dehydrogenase
MRPGILKTLLAVHCTSKGGAIISDAATQQIKTPSIENITAFQQYLVSNQKRIRFHLSSDLFQASTAALCRFALLGLRLNSGRGLPHSKTLARNTNLLRLFMAIEFFKLDPHHKE